MSFEKQKFKMFDGKAQSRISHSDAGRIFDKYQGTKRRNTFVYSEYL